MTTEPELRLLVALDHAAPNEAALRALSRLRGPSALEVTCLFVEDEDLLRAASLPGLREISLAGEQAVLDAGRLTRDLADAADRARLTFDAIIRRLAAEHARLQHRFLVAKGRLVEELHRAAEQSDLVMVTRELRTSGLRPRLGRSFLPLIRQPKPVLIVNEPWDSGSSVVVLAGDQSAIDQAGRIAEAEGLPLVVALRPDAEPPSVPQGATIRRLDDWEEADIAELCRQADARVLIAPAGVDVDWTELLVSLMDRLPCSLLKLAD